MKELPYSWAIGNDRQTHRGFAVYKIIGNLDKPMEMVSKIYESAQTAFDAAEKWGPGFAAFRVRKSGGNLSPLERIRQDDLPVTVSLNPRR